MKLPYIFEVFINCIVVVRLHIMLSWSVMIVCMINLSVCMNSTNVLE